MPFATRSRILTIVLFVTFSVAGCSGAAGVTVSEPWVRMTSPSAPAAAYFVINNSTNKADALLSVSTPAYADVQLHETVAMEPSPAASGSMPMGSMDPMASPSGMGGDMRGMQPVSEIAVPANGSVTLEPGGYHVMLMEPTGPLAVGDTIELTLTFRDAGKIVVKAPVKGA
jgi:copper(I)-binding protein